MDQAQHDSFYVVFSSIYFWQPQSRHPAENSRLIRLKMG
jgi:hypothetical protein